MAVPRPFPARDRDTTPFWEAQAQHELKFQRCSQCQHVRFPVGPMCPQCRSFDFDWIASSGRGTVYSYTVVHRPIAAGQPLPTVIAVIALEDAGGVRMISNLVGTRPEDVAIGMPVELVWEDMSAELAIPRFRPSAPARGSR